MGGRALAALTIASVATAVIRARESGGVLAPHTEEPRPASLAELAAFGFAAHPLGVTLARSEELDVGAVWYWGERTVGIHTSERGADGSWSEAVTRHSTSFDLTDLASGGSHVLFVAGVTHDGNDVIEEWRFDVQPGSYVCELAGGPSVLHEPPHVPPAERPAPSPPRRTVLFEGDLPGVFIDIVAEPERRFVYALLANHDLSVPTVVWVVDVGAREARAVFSSATESALRHGFRGMACMRHETRGSAVVLAATDQVIFWTVLWDADGDGVLEEATTVTVEELHDGVEFAAGWTEVSG